VIPFPADAAESGESIMRSILIVENNVQLREYFSELLHHYCPGISVHEASSAQDVIRHVARKCPDLIFMDVHLSGSSGFELTRRIKAENPQVAVIILTNYDYPEYREYATRFGADHFFRKDTLSVTGLVDVVKSVMSLKGDSCLAPA
jgi:DNA-binding NarL/FixJ family response regulator